MINYVEYLYVQKLIKNVDMNNIMCSFILYWNLGLVCLEIYVFSVHLQLQFISSLFLLLPRWHYNIS